MNTVKTLAQSIAILLLLAPASFAQQATQPSVIADSPQAADVPTGTSTVRIVRLSQIKGNVLLDRKTDRGFEVAFENLPIAQGEALKTNLGVAEVEFEDNSSLRILPDTVVEFPSLERTSTGATITTVKLLKGTVYVSLEKTGGNQFHILLGNSTITVTPATHIRLDAGTATAPSQLAVFKGSAQFTDASSTTTVDKKKTLTFNDSTQSPPILVSKVNVGPFDNWDKTSASYHDLHSVSSAYGNPSYTYGISDLNYYGSFANTACGSLWQPYFTGAGWDPFANGVWAWYPSAGYSWVSPYPWGWMPFHYGSWVNCGGNGWGWRPGGSWYGIQNQPATLITTRGAHVPLPPRAPGPGHQSTLVAYNAHPMPLSRLDSQGNFVFRKGSAGIGVPREYFGKLNHLSANTERHGTMSVPTTYAQNANPGANRGGEPQGSSRSANAQGRSGQASTYSAQSRSASAESRGSSPTRSGGEYQGSSSSSGWSHGSSAPSSSGGFSGGSSASAPAPSAPSGSSSGGGAHR